jgi:hypothetical protein
VTAPQYQYHASPPHPHLLAAAAAGKMTADVQMKDTEPQPAALPPAAAAAAPAVSTLQRKLPPPPLYGTLPSLLSSPDSAWLTPPLVSRSEGDRVGDRSRLAVQGGPPDLPRRPPHRRAPPPPRRAGRLRLPRLRAARVLRRLRPPLRPAPQGGISYHPCRAEKLECSSHG